MAGHSSVPPQVPPLAPALRPHCPGGDISGRSSWPDNRAKCPGRRERRRVEKAILSCPTGSGAGLETAAPDRASKRQTEGGTGTGRGGAWGPQVQGGEGCVPEVDRKTGESGLRSEGGLSPHMSWGARPGRRGGWPHRSPGHQALYRTPAGCLCPRKASQTEDRALGMVSRAGR